MAQPRCFDSVQGLRGLAALLVVVFHLAIVERKYGTGEALLPDFARFADAGVDLFFVISGFVMATIATGTYGSPANAGRFLARRAWRILPPYWFYTTLVLLLMVLAPGMANSAYANQSVLASYLLWPHAQLPVLTVGWTLVHEMYFYLVMAGMIALLRERAIPGALLAWGAVAILGWVAGRPGTPVSMLVSNPMTLEFIAGAFIGLYWRRLPCGLAAGCLAAGAAGFLLAMPALDLAGIGGNTPLLRTLVFGTSGALVVLGAVSIEGRCGIAMPGWLRALGDSSYSLYLSHVFVISAAGRAWAWTGWNGSWWQHAVFVAVAIIASVMAGMASHRVLEQPLSKLGRRVLPTRGGGAPARTVPAALQPD